jgi:hypothetical protein
MRNRGGTVFPAGAAPPGQGPYADQSIRGSRPAEPGLASWREEIAHHGEEVVFLSLLTKTGAVASGWG